MGSFFVRSEVLNYTHAGEHLLSAALVSSTPPFTLDELETIKCYTAEITDMILLLRSTGSSNPVLKEVRVRLASIESLSNPVSSISDYRHRVYEYVRSSEALLQVNEIAQHEKELLKDMTHRLSVTILGNNSNP